MNEILNKMIKKRQAVKEYSDKKIDNADWRQILESIYWSPSSHGFEPYRVLIINHGHKIRKELQNVMWGQGVVENARKLVLFISLKREKFADAKWIKGRTLRMATEVLGKNGAEAEEIAEGHLKVVKEKHLDIYEKNGDDWAMKQAYIALGSAMSAATILGIGSTPMEGFQRDKVIAVLKKYYLIDDFETIAVALSFGYPSSKTAYAHFGSNKRVRDPWKVKFKEI